MLKNFSGSQIIRSESAWCEWLSGLKDGDKCLYQDFVPLEPGVLGSRVECFRYWPAEFWGTRVWYDNATHPLKEGVGVYWNSDSPVNRVFPGRIVPWVEELVNPALRFVDSDRPIFESNWWADRCYVMADHGVGFRGSMGAARKLLEGIPHYRRDVNDGVLFTCFCSEEKLTIAIKESGANLRFLYSEDLR